MPYSVPEGYFGTLGEEMAGRIGQSRESKPKLLQKLTPYMATAAMFAMIVTAGTFFLRLTAEEDELTFEDYMVMSENLTGLAGYQVLADRAEETHLDTEDIADYLIYTGVGAENFDLLYE